MMPSFVKTLRRCHSTVRLLMKSWAPISGFVSPSTAKRAIWVSWGVRSVAACGPRLRTVARTDHVDAGVVIETGLVESACDDRARRRRLRTRTGRQRAQVAVADAARLTQAHAELREPVAKNLAFDVVGRADEYLEHLFFSRAHDA